MTPQSAIEQAKTRPIMWDHWSGMRTVPCAICGAATPMLGTERCDACWELEARIKLQPKRHRQVVEFLKKERREARLQRIKANLGE